MEWIWASIIIVILCAGSAIGGGFAGYNMKPATNITYQYISQTAESTTTVNSLTYTAQGQMTIVSALTNVNVNINGLTNISITSNIIIWIFF